MILIFLYLLIAAVVVFAAIKVSDTVDIIDKKSNISGALIGGVLLAATTSLPEVITSLTSVFLGEPHLAVGNIFGSNMFNILIIALADIYFFKYFFLNKVSNTNIKSLIFILIIYAAIGTAMLIPTGIPVTIIALKFSLLAVLTLIIYFLTIKNLATSESDSDFSENDDEHGIDISKKRIALSFVVWGLILISTSVIMTYLTDKIQFEFNLSTTLAGAIFLGIATSLPEAAAVFYLVKIKSYNLAIANVIGSNIFNLAILALVDFVYYKEDVFFSIKSEAFILWLFGLVNCSILLYTLCRRKLSNKFMYILPSILIVGMYITYLIISF